MVRAGRQARGSRCKRSSLTDETVSEIRRLYAGGGILQRELAARFGVSQPMVGYIVRRTWWRHVA